MVSQKLPPDSRRLLSRRESVVVGSTAIFTGIPGCVERSPPGSDQETESPTTTETVEIQTVDLTIPETVETGIEAPVTVTVGVSETDTATVVVGLESGQQPTETFETIGRETVSIGPGDTGHHTFSVVPQSTGDVIYRGWGKLETGPRVTTEMTIDTTPATRAWGDAVELANGLNVTVANPRFRGGYPPATTQSSMNGSMTAPGIQYALIDVTVTNTTDTAISLPSREAFRVSSGQTIHAPVSIKEDATGVYPTEPSAVAGGQTTSGTIGYQVESTIATESIQVVHQAISETNSQSWQARWQSSP